MWELGSASLSSQLDFVAGANRAVWPPEAKQKDATFAVSIKPHGSHGCSFQVNQILRALQDCVRPSEMARLCSNTGLPDVVVGLQLPLSSAIMASPAEVGEAALLSWLKKIWFTYEWAKEQDSSRTTEEAKVVSFSFAYPNCLWGLRTLHIYVDA